MRPSISVLGTGGTIASTESADGAEPSKRGEELVEGVPRLDDYASLDLREVVQQPSFDMDLPTLDTLREAVRGEIANGADGVIVTHGTDTMEESAYYLDMTLDIDAPVIFTGAQRRPDEVSPDGPANLLTAVRTVTESRIRSEGGVYIAFDEELHAARDVTKRHTRKLGAFASPEKGLIAATTRDEVRIYRDPGSYSVELVGESPDANVRMIKSGVGIGAKQVEDALDAEADGLIVEGTGLGNTTATLGDAIERAISAGLPVVITSRCHAGTTAPVYGTGGGGQTLADYGAIHGDDLPAHKARIKLQLALDRTDDPSQVESYFTGRKEHPRGD